MRAVCAFTCACTGAAVAVTGEARHASSRVAPALRVYRVHSREVCAAGPAA